MKLGYVCGVQLKGAHSLTRMGYVTIPSLGIVSVLLIFEKPTIHYTPTIPNILLVGKSKPEALKQKEKIKQ